MKPPSTFNLPIFEIKDDAECIKIAQSCGVDTEQIRLRLMEFNRRSGEPSFSSVILRRGPEVLILQFFAGYTDERQNGWSILGFANVDIYLQCQPQLIKHLFGDAHNFNCEALFPEN